MRRLDVDLAGRGYPIFIEKNNLQSHGAEISALCPGKRAAVISDENVWRLHGERLLTELLGLGIQALPIVVAPGEGSKSIETLTRVYEALFSCGLKRQDPVIAFGGGVVGDLAGFAAATYMRGVPLIQIPTTLLAHVDSSVGGKVAVNLKEGKNLAGCFYQPSLVLIGTDVLKTLPKREWNAGLAEVVKYAALGEARVGRLLQSPAGVGDFLEEIIYLCCKCKAAYVEADERDLGLRMMLNFGHSFGHAIEKYHRYETYIHGEAVAIGMALAAKTGELLGLSAPGTYQALTSLLEANGLSYTLSDDIQQLLPLMLGDKKNSGEEISLILLKRMGEPVLHKTSLSTLQTLWKEETSRAGA